MTDKPMFPEHAATGSGTGPTPEAAPLPEDDGNGYRPVPPRRLVKPERKPPAMTDQVPGRGFLTYADLTEDELANALAEAAEAAKQQTGYQGPGVFALGAATTIGTEILLDGRPVDYLQGRPLLANRFPVKDPNIYEKYFVFKTEALRLVLPEPVIFKGREGRQDYLETIPKPYRICGDDPEQPGHITLAPNELTLYLAEPEQGKSWLALQTLRTLNKPSLLIATEGVASAAKRMELINPDIWDNVEVFGGIPTGTDITALADNGGYDIVIIDVLAALLQEENQASSWNAFVRTFEPLLPPKTTGIICHHLGKNPALNARGTSAIRAAMTSIYTLKRSYDETTDTTIIKVRRDKDRNDYRPPGLDLHLFTTEEGFHLQALPPDRKDKTATAGTDVITEGYQKAATATRQVKGQPVLPTRSGLAKAIRGIIGGSLEEAYKHVDNATADKILLLRQGRGSGGYPGYELSLPEEPPT